MDYLLDSNIVIIYSRDNKISEAIEKKYKIFSGDNRLAISTVSLGEINATIKKLNVGEKRKDKIKEILDRVNEFSINFKEVIDRYGDIDAYSQGKLKVKKGKFSSRNMGKNDIWIAATASVFDLTLI
ncbi:MAG: type II toxin-antitoxin system VapC family toxin, partial [Bacteroidota bacterium]